MDHSHSSPFNWRAFLSTDPATITYNGWYYAIIAANYWRTCPTGALDVPRNGRKPVDAQLVALGTEFSWHVSRRSLKAAQETLDRIEKRVHNLCNESTTCLTETTQANQAAHGSDPSEGRRPCVL